MKKAQTEWPLNNTKNEACELCERIKPLTFHHLIPRAVHSTRRFVERYSREDMQSGLDLCKLCHDGIHDIIPNEKELADKFYTKELLLADSRIVKHVSWVKKQK